MDVLVSVLESRNLTHSSLIMRNLFTTLQVGASTHQSRQVEADQVRLKAAGPQESVALTLRNAQTQTVMFVRNVPLSLVSGHQQAITQWVAVYPPGDPRDLTFDQTAPRPDMPQVYLSIERVATTSPTASSPPSGYTVNVEEVSPMARPRGSIASPPTGGSFGTGSAHGLRANSVGSRSGEDGSMFSARSIGGGSSASYAAERRSVVGLAEDIKSRISASATAQRKAVSATNQLEEVQLEIERLRAEVHDAEAELQLLAAQRAAADQEREEVKRLCAKARETIRLRDLSILEFRRTRDEADRQLSQVIAERERAREDMDVSMRDFGGQMRSLAVELEQRRAEAVALAEEIQRCDRRILELHDGAGGGAQGGSAELALLRKQLTEANAELDRARAQAAECASQAVQAEERTESDRMHLASLEEAAKNARDQLKKRQELVEEGLRRSTTYRLAADDADRELLAQASRAAQLDGQVSENKIQLKDLEERARELLALVERNDSSRGQLGAEAARLRDQLAAQELEGEQLRQSSAALEQRLRETQDEVRRFKSRAAELEGKNREAEDARLRKRAELDATRRVLDTVLKSTGDEAVRLEDVRGCVVKEIASIEAVAEEKSLRLSEAQERAEDAIRALRALIDEKGQRQTAKQEAEKQLAALHPQFTDEEDRLQRLESEANELRLQAEASAEEQRKTESSLEERLRALESELAQERVRSGAATQAHEAMEAELESARGAIPEMHSTAVELSAEAERLGEQQRLARERLSEVESAAAAQAQELAELQETLEVQRRALTHATGAAEAEGVRERELRSSLDQTRSALGQRAAAAREELVAAQAQHRQAAEELAALREERSRLAAESERLEGERQEAAARLEKARELESAHAQTESEEAQLGSIARELEERLAEAAREAERLTAEGDALDTTLAVQRRRVEDVSEELRRHEAELADANEKRPSLQTSRTEAEVRAEALRRRCHALREELAPLELEAAKLPAARAELEAAEEERRLRAEARRSTLLQRDDELERTRVDVEQRNSNEEQSRQAKVEACSKRVDELAEEVKRLTAKTSTVDQDRAELAARISGAASEEDVARSSLSKELMQLGILQQEQNSLNQQRAALEQRLREAEEKAKPAEAQVERLSERVRELAAERAAATAAAASAMGGRAQLEAARAAAVEEGRRAGEAAAALVKAEAEREQVLARKAEMAQSVAERRGRQEELAEELARVKSEFEEAEALCRSFERDAAERSRQIEAVRSEASSSPAKLAEEQLLAEERKVGLLKAQLQNLSDAQDKAKAEALSLEGVNAELAVELQRVREEAQIATDGVAIQVEHGNIQYSTVQTLDEEIQRMEQETEILTLALHDADLQQEVLQKEHELLQQKVSGSYTGSVKDLASEVFSVRMSAEEERHRDELRHWMQVGREIEKDSATALEDARRQHGQIEAPLQARLEALVAECEQKVKDFERRFPEVSGSVHSVPAPLHGLVEPARPLPAAGSAAGARRALVIGCNYSQSCSPLRGCTNDAWSVQCLLRHSLRYAENQVLSLIDCSASCPTPATRLPTKANILAGLRWLTKDAAPGDSLALFFSGYGAQVPVAGSENRFHGCLLPMDFADDLPPGLLADGLSDDRAAERAQRAPPGAGYRLVALAELTAVLRTLPANCRVTVVLDCCHGMVPQLRAADAAPFVFPRAELDVDPSDVLDTSGATASGGRRPWRPRLLRLPPLPGPLPVAASGSSVPPDCRVHCYAACRSTQWCAELPIEGCVQGAFTWAFVKALTAGHLDTTVQQHMNSMRSILGNLRTHFRWIDQAPVLQLSGSAGMQDALLPP